MKQLKYVILLIVFLTVISGVFALEISTPINPTQSSTYGRSGYSNLRTTYSPSVSSSRYHTFRTQQNSYGNSTNSISQSAHNMHPSTHTPPAPPVPQPYGAYYRPLPQITNVVYKNNSVRSTSMPYYGGNVYYPYSSGGYYYYPPVTTRTTTVNTGNGTQSYSEQYFGNYTRNGINTVRSGNTTSMSRFLSW